MAKAEHSKDWWVRWQVRKNVKGKALEVYRASRRQLEAGGMASQEAHEQALAETYAKARGAPWGKEPAVVTDGAQGKAGQDTEILSRVRIREIYAKRRDAVRVRACAAYAETRDEGQAEGLTKQEAHEAGVAEVYAQGKAVSGRGAMIRRDRKEQGNALETGQPLPRGNGGGV